MSVELWVGGAGKSLVSRGTGSSKLEGEEEGGGVCAARSLAVMFPTSEANMGEYKNDHVT